MSFSNRVWAVATLLPVTALIACGPAEDIEADELAVSEDAVKPGAAINCRRDRGVDVPAAISSLTVESSRRIHVTTSAPSDSTGSARLIHFEFTNVADGAKSYYSITNTESCSSPDQPADLRLEGLAGGVTYDVVAVSQDGCGKLSPSAPVRFAMPADSEDVQAPTFSGLRATLYFVGFGSRAPYFNVYAMDDVAIDRVDYFVNGAFHGTKSYEGIHAWSNAGGESYYYAAPYSMQGQTVEVRADIWDVHGNLAQATLTTMIPVVP